MKEQPVLVLVTATYPCTSYDRYYRKLIMSYINVEAYLVEALCYKMEGSEFDSR
jgi:hypothetical protein